MTATIEPIETTLTTVADILAVNGQTDEQEPWCACDDCADVIEIRGEDIVALCADGVVRWTNTERAWSEVDANWGYSGTLQEIYDSHSGHNMANAAKFHFWMAEFWNDIPALRVEAGDGDDADTGRIESVDGDRATVAWDSLVVTTVPLTDLRIV